MHCVEYVRIQLACMTRRVENAERQSGKLEKQLRLKMARCDAAEAKLATAAKTLERYASVANPVKVAIEAMDDRDSAEAKLATAVDGLKFYAVNGATSVEYDDDQGKVATDTLRALGIDPSKEKEKQMILAGWNCAECLIFNSEEKEPQHVCRGCQKPRKTFGLPLDTHMAYVRQLEEQLRIAQERGTTLHNRVVELLVHGKVEP